MDAGGRVSCGDVVRAAARSSCGLERLQAKLADAQVSETVPHLRITFSAGLAAYTEHSEVKQAIERADKALYQAKADGRNRTVMAPELKPD